MKLYQEQDGALVRTGSFERFNRVLYGGHAKDAGDGRFFTFAGDTPIFMGASSDYRKNTWCHQAKNGVLMSGLAMTPGQVEGGSRDIFSKWFHDSGDITVAWKHGYLDYEFTQFSAYFPDVQVKMTALPLNPDEGFLVYYDITTDQRVIWCAGFGGITPFFGRFEYHFSDRKDFSAQDCEENQVRIFRDHAELSGPGDVKMLIGDNFGCDYSSDSPEAMLEVNPGMFLTSHSGEQRVIKLRRVIEANAHLQGTLVVLKDGTPERLHELLKGDTMPQLRRSIRSKYAAVSFSSPDERLNMSVPDTLIALDASFHGKSFYHGAIGYHAPFLGWRGWYAPVLAGWDERVKTAILSHFDTILHSDPPEKVWWDGGDRSDLDHEGTQYHHLENTSGRLTALLHRDDIYDMQEVAIDMTLYYFDCSRDLKTALLIYDRLLETLDWQERILDPDGDGLYQNFLNTWISDGHSYNGAGCAQASCYNLRSNLRTAALGQLLGKDVSRLEKRAEKIRQALQDKLWLEDKGVLAESLDTIGNKLIHPSPELSTVYLAIECEALTPEQAKRMLRWTSDNIKTVTTRGSHQGKLYFSSRWLPKKYSTYGIFPAENSALALAFFKAGMTAEAMEIINGLADVFELSPVPGSISHVSAASGAQDEGDIDFTDVSSCYLRTLFEGLWGVEFRLCDNRITFAPQIPSDWQTASLTLPQATLAIQHEAMCDILTVSCCVEAEKVIILPQRHQIVDQVALNGKEVNFRIESNRIFLNTVLCGTLEVKIFYTDAAQFIPADNQIRVPECGRLETVDISQYFNASLTGIHNQEFRSPRPAGYSIGLRRNGRYAWEWNHYGHNALHVDDSLLRQARGTFTTMSGIPFKTPETGANTVAVSVWDNFPTQMEIPLTGKAERVHILFCGTTNAMQSEVVNARIKLKTAESDIVLDLIPPENFDDFLIATYQRKLESVYLSDGTHALHAVIDIPADTELSALHIEGVANEAILMLLGVTVER